MARSKSPWNYPPEFEELVKLLWKGDAKQYKEIRIDVPTPGVVHSRCTTLYAWRKAVLEYTGKGVEQLAEIRSLLEKTSFGKDMEKLQVVVRRGGAGEEFANDIRKALGMPTRQEEREEAERVQKEMLERMKMQSEGKGAEEYRAATPMEDQPILGKGVMDYLNLKK